MSMLILGVLVGIGLSLIGLGVFVRWLNKNPPNFLPW